MDNYHVPHRRSSGKNNDRLGAKLFSYYREEERDKIVEAAKRADLSMSSFIAKASIEEATRVLGEAPPKPLSLEDLLSELKNGVAQRKIEASVKRNGITFTMSGREETLLQKAGAQGGLLWAIHKTRK